MLAKNAEGKCGVKQYLSKKYTESKTAVHFLKNNECASCSELPYSISKLIRIIRFI